jgi:hypothetical protein
MRAPDEILNTPVGLLTDEEISTLSPAGQEYARRVKANRAREAACPGHEKLGTGTDGDGLRGWHPGHCKHCGIDMSVDSGD